MGHFVEEPEDGAPLWRYMDLAKFVSLLDGQALWFPRADRLSDPLEGSLTSPDVAARAAHMKNQLVNVPENVRRKVDLERLAGNWETLFSASVRNAREAFAVSCWHENEGESAAMWDLYSARGNGIAVRTTFADLKTALQNPTKNAIVCSKVHYIDFSTEEIPKGNPMFPLLYKRSSFAHEREVRLIGQLVEMPNPAQYEYGISVPVDLANMVKEVYVFPEAPKWFADAVRSLVNRYGLNVPVEHSAMDVADHQKTEFSEHAAGATSGRASEA